MENNEFAILLDIAITHAAKNKLIYCNHPLLKNIKTCRKIPTGLCQEFIRVTACK